MRRVASEFHEIAVRSGASGSMRSAGSALSARQPAAHAARAGPRGVERSSRRNWSAMKMRSNQCSATRTASGDAAIGQHARHDLGDPHAIPYVDEIWLPSKRTVRHRDRPQRGKRRAQRTSRIGCQQRQFPSYLHARRREIAVCCAGQHEHLVAAGQAFGARRHTRSHSPESLREGRDSRRSGFSCKARAEGGAEAYAPSWHRSSMGVALQSAPAESIHLRNLIWVTRGVLTLGLYVTARASPIWPAVERDIKRSRAAPHGSAVAGSAHVARDLRSHAPPAIPLDSLMFVFRARGLPWAVAARLLRVFYRGAVALEIDCDDIGAGMCSYHGFATIITARRIGQDCLFAQQVTVGYDDRGGSADHRRSCAHWRRCDRDRADQIADDAVIGAGRGRCQGCCASDRRRRRSRQGAASAACSIALAGTPPTTVAGATLARQRPAPRRSPPVIAIVMRPIRIRAHQWARESPMKMASRRGRHSPRSPVKRLKRCAGPFLIVAKPWWEPCLRRCHRSGSPAPQRPDRKRGAARAATAQAGKPAP